MRSLSATKPASRSGGAFRPSPSHPMTLSELPLPRQIRQTPSATKPASRSGGAFRPSPSRPMTLSELPLPRQIRQTPRRRTGRSRERGHGTQGRPPGGRQGHGGSRHRHCGTYVGPRRRPPRSGLRSSHHGVRCSAASLPGVPGARRLLHHAFEDPDYPWLDEDEFADVFRRIRDQIGAFSRSLLATELEETR